MNKVQNNKAWWLVLPVFLLVAFSVLFYAIGAIRKARANPQRSDRETPYVGVDPAMAAQLH